MFWLQPATHALLLLRGVGLEQRQHVHLARKSLVEAVNADQIPDLYAHAFHAFRQQCMDCQLRHDRRSKWFNYSLRHLPVTILITGKPRCNYISPTGQFGEYRHKNCIRHRSRISQFDWHHRLQLTPQNNSASTRADFLHY